MINTIEMATIKQKKIAKLIVENTTLDKPLNGKQMLAKVSYSDGLQKQPSRVIESEGVQEELQVLGFTEENAMNVVSEIMLNPEAQDNNRLKAAEQVFKVTGSYAPERKINLNANIDIEKNKEANKLADEYEDKLLNKLLE